MQKLSDKLKDIPKQPGIYQFLNKTAEVIYVGKAKNLKSRVAQYFSGHDTRPQLPYLIAEAVDVNYTVVSNELESAFLENTLIKQYVPKYNIDLKDDKNYAFITIDYSTEIPQIGYSRKIQEPSTKNQTNSKLKISNFKTRYFGPYSSAYKIKQTLNLVRRIFPYCAAQKVSNRPCFYYFMHRCPGVCVGKITVEEYKLTLEKITKFLQGNAEEIIRDIKKEMQSASKNKKFEAAARLRDQLRALEILSERQNVILPKKVDWDLVSLASSDGFACVNLFKIRGGKMFDKESFVYELPDFFRRHSEGVQPPFDGAQGALSEAERATEESLNPGKGILRPSPSRLSLEATLSDAEGSDALGVQDDALSEVLQRFLEQYYLETSSIPKNVYTQIPAHDAKIVEEIISSRFNRKAHISTPQKGKLSKLINLGKTNAEEYLKNWLQSKAGNLDKINQALEQLKEVLDLPMVPKRIECYDISNTQGTNPVGSMVVFQDGLPMKSQYRKFKIQGKKTPDDFAMMKEMLSRRFARIRNNELGIREKDKWPMPDLIVIDGGKGQLGVAESIIHNSKFIIPVIGLAKRIEEIFLPNEPQPIILDHNQPALQLLQRLRDEAHRFGITFHRKLRSKEAVRSALDSIPGIGPKTKKLLKSKFGTVANIKKTSFDDLANAVGKHMAELIQKSI